MKYKNYKRQDAGVNTIPGLILPCTSAALPVITAVTIAHSLPLLPGTPPTTRMPSPAAVWICITGHQLKAMICYTK